MAVDILMPNLGFDTQTGRLIEWLKQVGETVQKGEIIAIVESDKANVELEALAGGVLLEQLAQPDEEVAVGAVIARLGSASEAASQPAQAPATAGAANDTTPLRVSPLAQRIAQDLRVNTEQLAGSGARGRVTRRDVEAQRSTAQPESASQSENGGDRRGVRALPKVRRAAREQAVNLADMLRAGYANPIGLSDLEAYLRERQSPAPVIEADAPPQDAQEIALSRTRQIIGKRLGESMREAPHFYVTGEFDLEDAIQHLKGLTPPVRINDLLLYLTAQTLSRVPSLNATWNVGRLYRHHRLHLAVAVARDDGLITPVIHDVQRYSLHGLAEISRPLIERARQNRLQADDLQGGTFTVSNLGMVRQVDHFTAVINPPQVAILAIGSVKPRPVVVNGGLFIRQTVNLTLSGDHRAVDGMDLARFMTAFQEELDRFSRG